MARKRWYVFNDDPAARYITYDGRVHAFEPFKTRSAAKMSRCGIGTRPMVFERSLWYQERRHKARPLTCLACLALEP